MNSISEQEDDLEDAMIRAARNSETTTDDILDICNQKGLIGVYNLGLKDMYEYLTESYKK